MILPIQPRHLLSPASMISTEVSFFIWFPESWAQCPLGWLYNEPQSQGSVHIIASKHIPRPTADTFCWCYDVAPQEQTYTHTKLSNSSRAQNLPSITLFVACVILFIFYLIFITAACFILSLYSYPLKLHGKLIEIKSRGFSVFQPPASVIGPSWCYNEP